MASIFTKKESVPSQVNYSVEKLLVRSINCDVTEHSKNSIICDIDKTYLETTFESFVQMAKTAIEDADDKQTVRGANEVLKVARWNSVCGKPNPLHFVTASPPQLKSVLEEKLRLDDIHWNSVIFKNQAYNIRKGRMSLLRHHVAYKTLALHNILVDSGPGVAAYMIGDNAELDSYIYTGVSLFLKGILSKQGYVTYLEAAGTDPQVVQELVGLLAPLSGSKIGGIYIRRVPGFTTYKAGRVTDGICYFDSFYEVALDFYLKGIIDDQALWPLTRSFHNQHQADRVDLARYLLAAEQRATADKKIVLESLLIRLAEPGDLDLEELRGRVKLIPAGAEVELTEADVLSLAQDWMEGVRQS